MLNMWTNTERYFSQQPRRGYQSNSFQDLSLICLCCSRSIRIVWYSFGSMNNARTRSKKLLNAWVWKSRWQAGWEGAPNISDGMLRSSFLTSRLETWRPRSLEILTPPIRSLRYWTANSKLYTSDKMKSQFSLNSPSWTRRVKMQSLIHVNLKPWTWELKTSSPSKHTSTIYSSQSLQRTRGPFTWSVPTTVRASKNLTTG